MSEIEQLTHQKEEIEKSQAALKNWVALKKNLSAKFKNPSEAFKALKKEDKDVLAIEDFGDYAKGLDLTEVLKDTQLNEKGFTEAWEQWEFKQDKNQHSLQMINEKLKLQTMLDKGEDGKAAQRALDAAPNKKVPSIAKDCETLDQLQEKLDTLVGEGQKQKDKSDVVENEQECFAEFLAKKSEVKAAELQISKLQLKTNEEVEETQTQHKPKKSYIDGSSARNKGSFASVGNLLQSSLQNKGSLGGSQISVKQSFIIEPSIQISPQKGQQILRNYPQQPPKYEERQVEERKSHKVNRMKGDLQSYISELFQNEKDSRQQQVKYFDRPSSQDQKGLAGFMNYKKYFKNPQPKTQITEPDTDVHKRVQSIRYKLDDFQSQKLAQYNYVPRSIPEWTPDRPLRLSNPKPKQGSGKKQSPKYTPGNTHRLNLEYLKQEKEKDQSDPKHEEQQAS